MKIYDEFPTFENDDLILRPVKKEDSTDLLAVYSDKNALPFFNSDNCVVDNFYYPLLFWQSAYENKWFARWAIVEKADSKVIGTIELCRRASDDVFNGAAILRIDIRSDHEKEDCLFRIGSLIVPPAFELFECQQIITKAPVYAIERISALQRLGFQKSGHFLIGKTGYAYDGYWSIESH